MNLQEILDKHKLWLETSGKEGERANLKDANLQGANLQGADLRGTSLDSKNTEGIKNWHDPKDSRPNNGEVVIVYTEEDDVFLAYRSHDDWYFEQGTSVKKVPFKVLLWCVIPDLPKEVR
jgi:hypothetical protein